MVKTIVKEGSLCLMLDGEHSGRVGVCIGIYPQESEMIRYNFMFSDGNKCFVDDKELPRNFRRLGHREFCNN